MASSAVVVNPERFTEKFERECRRIGPRKLICDHCLIGAHKACQSDACECVHREIDFLGMIHELVSGAALTESV